MDLYPAIALGQLKKGQKVSVRLPNQNILRLPAAVDSVDTNVFIADGKVYASTSVLTLQRTNKLFKTRPTGVEESNFPYLSLFVDQIEGDNFLFATYNNAFRPVGEISFAQFDRLNFQFLGNGQFIGTGLSQNKDKFVVFNSANAEVIEQPETLTLSLFGTTDLSAMIYTGDVLYLPETPVEEYEPRNLSSVFTEYPNTIRNFTSTNYTIDPNGGVNQREYGGNSFAYSETRNLINAIPGGSTTFAVDWSFAKPNTFIEVYTPGFVIDQPHSSSADLSYTYTENRLHTWDYENNYPIKSSDNSDRFFVDKTSGTNYYYETENNQNNTTYTVTGTAPNFNTTYSASGTITKSETIGYDFVTEKKEPVVVSNVLTLEDIRTEDLDFEQVTDSTITYSNVFPNNSNASTCQTTSNVASTSDRNDTFTAINLIINLGKIGIYIEAITVIEENIIANSSSDLSQGVFIVEGQLPNQPTSSRPGVLDVVSTIRDSGFSGNPPTGTSSSLSTANLQRDNNSFYKLAYNTVTPFALKPGFANTCTVSVTDKDKIVDFLADPDNALNTITVTFNSGDVERDINKIATRVRINEVVSLGAPVTGSTTYTRVDLDPLDSRGLDLNNDDEIILKTEINSVLYLVKGKITSFSTTETSEPSDSSRVDEVTLNSINIEIESAEIITSFFTTSDFIYTVDGCDIFNFLDPNLINLIEIEVPSSTQPALYLSVAMPMPEVDDNDTQTLIFEVQSDRISYIGITGGDISNVETSDGAEPYIKFYQFPFQF